MARVNFYNAGPRKGLTRRVFYQELIKALNGEAITDDMAQFLVDACNYELAIMDRNNQRDRAKNAAAGKTGKINQLETDYAKCLAEDVKKVLSVEVQSVKDIVEKMKELGIKSTTGKNYPVSWTGNVLKNGNIPYVERVSVVETKKSYTEDGREIVNQAEKFGYKLTQAYTEEELTMAENKAHEYKQAAADAKAKKTVNAEVDSDDLLDK